MQYANLNLTATASYSFPITDEQIAAGFSVEELTAMSQSDWQRNLIALFGSMVEEVAVSLDDEIHYTVPTVEVTATLDDERAEGQQSNRDIVDAQMTDLILSMFGFDADAL